MKKFIGASVAAFGIVGFLGLGASAASAQPAVPHVSVQGTACTTIAADQSALSISVATANSTLSAAESAFSTIGESLATDSSTFASAYNTFIQAIVNSNPLGGPEATLIDANTTLTKDLATWGKDETAVNNAQNVVNADGVSSTLLSDMASALGC